MRCRFFKLSANIRVFRCQKLGGMKREKEPSDPTRDGGPARGLDLRTVSRRPWMPAWLQLRSSGSRCVASNRCFQRSLSVLALLLSGAQGRRMVSNQHKCSPEGNCEVWKWSPRDWKSGFRKLSWISVQAKSEVWELYGNREGSLDFKEEIPKIHAFAGLAFSRVQRWMRERMEKLNGMGVSPKRATARMWLCPPGLWLTHQLSPSLSLWGLWGGAYTAAPGLDMYLLPNQNPRVVYRVPREGVLFLSGWWATWKGSSIYLGLFGYQVTKGNLKSKATPSTVELTAAQSWKLSLSSWSLPCLKIQPWFNLHEPMYSLLCIRHRLWTQDADFTRQKCHGNSLKIAHPWVVERSWGI